MSEDSPPSYSEAMRTNQDQAQAQSIWTTPIQQNISGAGVSPSRNLLDLDIGTLPAAESPKSPSLPANSGLGFKPNEKSVKNSSFNGNISRTSQSEQNTRCKRVYRNWNPPMLGNLPDDFLRLIPPDTPSLGAGASSSASLAGFNDNANVSASHMSDLVASDRPKVHKSRSKSEKVSRSFSATPSDFKSRDRDSRSRSEKKSRSDRAVDKMSKSFSLADDTVSPRASDKVSRSHSSRHREWNGHSRDFMNGRSPGHHSVVGIIFTMPPDSMCKLKINFLISQPKYMLWVLKHFGLLERFPDYMYVGVPMPN